MGPETENLTADENEQKSDSGMEIVQDSALLSLPPEVLQTITRHMDASTFFVSLLTCKHLFKAADCRPNVIKHLYNLPGLRLGLDEISTTDLLLHFRKRAAESGCAAGALADIALYGQTSRTSLRNAAFSPANPANPGTQAQLATVHDGGIIHVYDLGKHQVRLKAELHIRPEDGDDRRMQVARMAFAPGSRDLAVLYRHVPSIQSSSMEVYKLVTFHHLAARTKGSFYDSHQQETKDLKVLTAEVPVGLALANNGYACIAWKNQILQHTSNITLIGRDEKLMEACNYDSNPQVLRIQDPDTLSPHLHKERQIFDMQFVENDRKLNLYKAGHPIHSFYTNTCNPSREECGPLMTNLSYIDVEPDNFLSNTDFQLGMPFHAVHAETITSGQPTTQCQISYLALGLTRLNNEGSNHPNAFVVQANRSMPSTSCCHEVFLDQGRRLLAWKVVALLAGWRSGGSSLGTVVSISPDGKKIAAATWSRILVWSLDPGLLHEGELEHYFPARDYNKDKGLGRLRPTLLSPQGVVYRMLWTDETHLYATTDKGLARWDMGVHSDGEREEYSLLYDAWPETAVAVPAMPHGLRKRFWEDD
ncbi:hypothetical protein ACLMJK_004405 [Lecanora helva]